MTIFIFNSGVKAENIYIEKMESSSVEYSFSNARFVDYEGRKALSVNVVWYVNTTFLSRTIPLASIRLHYRDKEDLEKRNVTPGAFNSTTFGTIFNLDEKGFFSGGVEVSDSGDKITKKEDITDSVSGIETESKESHRGSLLFILPQNCVMIYGISIAGKMTGVRNEDNTYIPLKKQDVNVNSIYEILKEVIIPSTGHIALVEIFDAINKFDNLNKPLKGAW